MDLFGNRVERRLDQGNNGTIEERTTYSYDENDRLLEEIAFDVVQSVETERTRTTYDWQVTQQAAKTVRSAAGQVQTRQEFGYDLHGRLARVVSETRDASDAVTSRQRVDYAYDQRGVRIRAETSNDSNLAMSEFEAVSGERLHCVSLATQKKKPMLRQTSRRIAWKCLTAISISVVFKSFSAYHRFFQHPAMNFNDYALDLKSRAQNSQWFSRVGTSDLGADVLRIDCWNTAILQMSEDDFGLAQNDASNATRLKFIAEYCDGDPRKFDGKKWNKCAGECEGLAEKVSKPLAKHAKTNAIPSKVVVNFKSAVLQDLLSLGMTGKRSEEFFGAIVNFYLNGFCPCGYVGKYPHGKLVVY